MWCQSTDTQSRSLASHSYMSSGGRGHPTSHHLPGNPMGIIAYCQDQKPLFSCCAPRVSHSVPLGIKCGGHAASSPQGWGDATRNECTFQSHLTSTYKDQLCPSQALVYDTSLAWWFSKHGPGTPGGCQDPARENAKSKFL